MTPRRRKELSPTRILVFVLVVGALWGLALLGRRAGERYLHTWIEEQASLKVGAAVSIGELEIDLLPLGARARELVVTSLESSTILASAESVEIGARWRDLDATPRRLRSITVVDPRVRVERREDGSLSWPDFEAGDGTGRGVAIDRLSLRGGGVEFVDRIVALDLDLRGVRAQASGESSSQFSGRFDAAEAIVGLPTGATYIGAVSARGVWESGRLRLVSGRLSGPDLRMTVTSGALDLGDKSWAVDFDAAGRSALFLALGVGDRELLGDWQFAGSLSGGESWELAGRLSGQGVGLDDWTLARLEGDLVADPLKLALSGIQGRFSGGALRARVEVAWADPGRPVRVEGELAEASIPALLTKFALDFPELAGTWGGNGHYTFLAEDPMAGSGAADIALRAHDRAGRLAWERLLPIDIVGGLATFSTQTSDTARERIAARGSYDLRSGLAELDYRIDTESAGAWVDLVGLGGDPEVTRWLPSAGQGSVEGQFHAVPGDWWSRLTLDLREALIGGFSPMTVRGPLSVSGAGVRDMRLELGRFEAAILVAGSIETRPDELSRLSLGIEVSGWGVEEFLAQLELPPSLSGPLEGSARITGTSEAFEVASYLSVAPAMIGDLPVDSVETEMAVADGLVRLDSGRVAMPAGAVQLGGVVPLEDGELDLSFSLRLDDLEAEPTGSRLPAGSGGRLVGRGSIGGTLEAPVLRADLESSDLRLADQDLSAAGPSRLTVRLAEGRLELDGALGEILTVGGGGALSDTAADLELAVASDRLGALMAIAIPDSAPGLEGGFRGTVRLVGGLEAGLPPPEIQLDELTLVHGEHRLTAIEPVKLVLRGDVLEVESFFLGDDATSSEVFLFGRIALAEGEGLDLQGQISLATEWFEPLLPGWTIADGRFEALASVGGTFTRPEINGQGEVRQPVIRSEALPQALRDIEAIVLFYPDQIVVDDGAARFAGGSLRAAGTLSPFDPAGLQYRFQVGATDIQLRYPEGWQVRGDAELVIASEPGGQLVRGRVLVDGALYTSDVPIGLTQLLQTAFSRRVELVEESDEVLASTRLNIIVRGEDALNVRNNIASLRGGFDLVVRGNLARPVIFGDVDVEPGGTLLYAGNTYEVQRASLEFVNPYRIEPVIDLVATTRLAQHDVTLDLSGTLERLDVNFASNPPLADLEVLALLAGGESSQASDYGKAGADSTGIAESFLYNQAASVVAARFNRLFGLDKFRIDPLTGESGNLSSARVTAGKRLSGSLFATYSYDPSQSGQQILELEWRVSRELTVVATQNGDSSYALDLRWDKSF